jgi:hypothetical protein
VALWAGLGGVEVDSGRELGVPSPHAKQSRGCLACHDSGPDTLALGRDHAFQAPMTACASCHSTGGARSPDIRARAESLYAGLASSDSRRAHPSDPPHANPEHLDLSTPRGRALHDVLLVLEDPAADVHNPAYASILLDQAARAVRKGEMGRRAAGAPPP